MSRHAGHRCWHCSARPADASILEQDNLPSVRKRIGDGRILIVHRSREVLQA